MALPDTCQGTRGGHAEYAAPDLDALARQLYTLAARAPEPGPLAEAARALLAWKKLDEATERDAARKLARDN